MDLPPATPPLAYAAMSSGDALEGRYTLSAGEGVAPPGSRPRSRAKGLREAAIEEVAIR